MMHGQKTIKFTANVCLAQANVICHTVDFATELFACQAKRAVRLLTDSEASLLLPLSGWYTYHLFCS
jgi:hypothetical protein